MSRRKAYHNRLEELFSSTETPQPKPVGIVPQKAVGETWQYSYTDAAGAMDRDLMQVIEFGRAIASLERQPGFLHQAADLIREQFRLYHVQIYLFSPGDGRLVLGGASGTAGKELLREKRGLPIDARSIVGLAYTTEQPVSLPNITASELYQPSDLLPETCAEMALPLISPKGVFGVLDLHSAQPDDFVPARQMLFGLLASRLSVILNIPHEVTEGEQVGGDQTLAQARVHEGWDEFLDAISRTERLGYRDDTEAEAVVELSAPLTHLLPTSSILTTPLQVSGEAIGTLLLERQGDVEPSEPLWSEEEANLVRTIADRIAQHIENLRLLAQAESYRAEAEEAARRLTRASWEQYIATPQAPPEGFVYDLNRVKPLTGKDILSARGSESGTTVFKSPIKVRQETIGELAYTNPTTDPAVASNILATIADRLSAHIENLRLLEETERSRQQLDKRAAELETVARVSTASTTILSPQDLLQSVVDLTKYSFNLYHAQAYLLDDLNDSLVLKAGAGKTGHHTVSEGEVVSMSRENINIVRAALTRSGVIVNDLRAQPGFLPHPLLQEAASELCVPMIVGDQLLGVFDVLANTPERFSEEDLRTYTTLAAQISVGLRNAELYEEQIETVLRLRELDHLKSAFLANMSHELRTPLNSILGFSQVILEGIDGPLTESMQADLSLIEKNGQHLLQLINDVLDMAKIEAGRMSLNFEPFNLNRLLEDVLDMNSSLARDRGLYLMIECDPVQNWDMVGDRFRLRQVLTNLIGNALKFTESGGITIYANRTDQNIKMRISDTGIGIPPDMLETIFEAFSQVDISTTRKAGGTGLGLPISRRLITLHGGRLWAESKGIPGQGSSFLLEIPVDVTLKPEKKEE